MRYGARRTSCEPVPPLLPSHGSLSGDLMPQHVRASAMLTPDLFGSLFNSCQQFDGIYNNGSFDMCGRPH